MLRFRFAAVLLVPAVLSACSEAPTSVELPSSSPSFDHAGTPAGTCLSDQWTLIEVTTNTHERYDKNKNDHICEKEYNTTKGNKTFTQTEYSDDILK